MKFWEETESMWNEQNKLYRENMMEINAERGLKAKKHIMKHFSYWGAIKVEAWAMKWSDPKHPGYADIGNYWYAHVFRTLWGESHISKYSNETIGDHVEALLGWFIYLNHRRTRGGDHVEFGERVHDTINMLNQALFSKWVLGTFFPSN